VDGYRPGVIDRLGFGRQAIFDLVNDRPCGIIHERGNCYGRYGPWVPRSGWQQISDAVRDILISVQSIWLGESLTRISFIIFIAPSFLLIVDFGYNS
jgi:hypothetical protein